MRGVNKVILIGNIGGDPEMRYAQSGAAVANVSIATSESWKDKTSGERQERTEWHKVVFFKRLAEIAGEYLKKGSQVYIEGNLRTRKWQDKEGHDRYSTEIVAQQMQMLGGRGDAQNPDQGQRSQPANAAHGANGGSRPAQAPPRQEATQATPPVEFDDDIPF